MSKIVSYKGLLEDTAVERIRLSTNDGLTGYQIKRFDLMSNDYGTATADSHTSVVKIFNKDPQAGATEFIDFTEETLLAAATFERNTSVATTEQTIFFDNKIVNQDIFITHKDVQAGRSVNYYLELEQIKLSKEQATMATLQNIRSNEYIA